MIILSMRVKKKVGDKFGVDKREKGLGWYAAMRSMQMRFMRLPKPQVKRGQHPADRPSRPLTARRLVASRRSTEPAHGAHRS